LIVVDASVFTGCLVGQSHALDAIRQIGDNA
jgi:hypothetical protein